MPNRIRVWALAALLGAAEGAGAQCPSQRIVPPVGWDRALFGNSVQIEGDVAVIADPSDDTFCPIFTCSSGAVHVFRRAGGAWGFEQTLFHSRISDRDVFGAGISLDGTERFAASAGNEDVVADGAGAVYIFEHNGAAWNEVAEILPVEPQWGNGFGQSLALRGDTLVVGAPKYISGAVAPGAAYVYRLVDGRWEFAQKLVPPDPRTGARFGNALAMEGEWLMVGAPLDNELGHLAGVVYVYRRDSGGDFLFVEKLRAPMPEDGTEFGSAIAMTGGILAVGAPNGVSTGGRGAVHLHALSAGAWGHVATLEHEDPAGADALGAAVAFRGDTVVAGAPRQPIPASTRQGVAYVFHRRADGSWRQAAKLVPDLDDRSFGRAVATDGASVLLGAPGGWVGGLQTGAARAFDLPCLLCRADLDGDGELTFFDFLAFQNLFAAGDMTADFDGDGELTFFDFLAFQDEFAAGCA